MKKTILFLILTSVMTNAQINRFYYDYKFIPDSNNKVDVKKEMMYLDIDKNGSTYYSHDKFINDSTTMADIQKQIKSGVGNLNFNRRGSSTQISYKVKKSYPNYLTYLYTTVSMDKYKIKENEKPDWKILEEKQKIGEYNAQKATVNYLGRDWIAWFSTEIPFQDGPYKFSGLPGLIIKIEDTTGSHSMTLIGNKKVSSSGLGGDAQMPSNVLVMGAGGKELEVTKQQFKKLWKDYLNDPTKSLRQMVSIGGGGRVSITSSDGQNFKDTNKMIKEIEKKTKEQTEKDNNPIELDLYK